ncbi:MAG: hypothetical protein JOZ46_02050 [Candidatus Dormibacteraeota bacterium]|nr:hypothetical protein [Candidatus Dormibacteraeota bacterium]MBV9524578.1 hypothetical protein [Candidatus Dormibacteraeota bacterium]
MVTALLPSPSATPVVTPTPPPPPPTSPPAPASFSFAIVPRFAGGAGGTVTATPMADRVHYHVVVTGLVPGSAHTVHDHVGSCGGANLSRHLSVLATGVANGAGSLTFDATVPAFEFGSGRIVIVYDSARPVLITGCAAL